MERSASDNPVLIAQSGPLNGRRWTLSDELTIGRDAACDVVIADRQVSRFHARLTLAEDRVILEDLASKNGTYRNGHRLTDPIELEDGDTVQISLIQFFTFLSSDATMPLEAGPVMVEEGKPGLILDSRARRVWVKSQEVVPPLSVPQFTLLEVLYERKDQVVSRQELVDAIWGSSQAEGVSEQAVDALVRRLRDRLAELNPDHNYIVTVRGHGLRLED
jgi:pSer/pThr/pTyr-binding forkhead associated (FHA) protein